MLLPFRVLKDDDESDVSGIDYPILLNKEHITSIKPINIMRENDIISGFWVRLVNGKKYKATRVPREIFVLFTEEKDLVPMIVNGEHVELSLQ